LAFTDKRRAFYDHNLQKAGVVLLSWLDSADDPLLRRYLPRMGWWIGATTLGWFLATVIILFLTEGLTMNANWFYFWIIPSLIGGSVGFGQWLLLRRRVPRAGWWIPATIAGWLAVRLAAGETLVGPLDIAYLAILPALATAVTFGLLIRQAMSPESKHIT
jgi:hypothetical protein